MRLTYNTVLDILTMRWSDAPIAVTRPVEGDDLMMLDFDIGGRVIGFELMGARAHAALEALTSISFRVQAEA